MTTAETEALKNDLEALIDGSSLRDVTEALVTVCREKAEHIRANWQDSVTAKTWTKDGELLDKLSVKITN